jgi:hypothetical protein
MIYFDNFKVIPYDINGDGVSDLIVNLTQLVKISESMISNNSFFETFTIHDGERPEQLSYRLYGSTEYYWTFLMLNTNIKNIWNDWPKSTSQLLEYSERKYEHLAATTDDDLLSKFVVGENIIAASGAIGKIREVHVNNKFIVFEHISGTFKVDGESIYGLDSQDSIAAMQIKSFAHAPLYHIDSSTGNVTLPRTSGTHPFTNYDLELAHNDNNRNIKVFKPDHIVEISQAIISELNN